MFPFFLTDCKTAVLFFTKPKLMSLCSFFQTDKKPDTLWDGGKIVQNLHSLPKMKILSSVEDILKNVGNLNCPKTDISQNISKSI